MPIVLYHEKEPQGRAFDRDSAREALKAGWHEKEEEDAIKTGEIEESNIGEHSRDDGGGSPAKTSRGSGIKQRKKPGRKPKNERQG